MQNVVIASKMKYHNITKEMEIKYNDNNKIIIEQSDMINQYKSQINDYKEQIINITNDLNNKDDIGKKLHEQLMRWKAEAASEHLHIEKMQEKVEIIENSESAKFKYEYDRMSKALIESKQIEEKLSKQLRVAMQRVYELQGQLLGGSEVASANSKVLADTGTGTGIGIGIGDEKDDDEHSLGTYDSKNSMK